MDPSGCCTVDCSLIDMDTDDANMRCVKPDCDPGEIWDKENGCHIECKPS